MMPRILAWNIFVGLMVCNAGFAYAQGLQNKPVRIVTASPGSGVDLTARLIAPIISENVGQQVVIDNRGGIISTEMVLKAAPDGHTLLMDGFTVWLLPFIRKDVSYDPVRDFSPVALLVNSPNLLVVHPSLPVRSVRELIALAKAKPGALNYASGSIGGAPHLAVELFKAMAGVNIVHIPYNGTARGISELMGGHVQLMISTVASLRPFVKAGRLKALAVTSSSPSALAPGLPTVAASGVPGYESTSVYGMLAPAKTPAAAISQLNRAIAVALNKPDMKEKMFGDGLEVIASTPEEFASVMKSDMAKWGKLIKDLGIRD